MSHDTHAHQDSAANNPSIAFKSAFYFFFIIAGLFVAAMAFVKAESHDESGHEATHEMHGTHEAANHETNETGETKAHETEAATEGHSATEAHH